jgi:hypothetical protein
VILLISIIVTMFVSVLWLASVVSFFAKYAGQSKNPIVQVLAPVAVPLTTVLFITVLIFVTLIPR